MCGLQVAFSSAINAFLAPSASSVITNTTIITQALASSGLWLPCATAFFTADSATLQDYLATTLQSDPNLILPTATWGSVRTANIKVAQPAAPASITYIWNVGEYTNCSVMCGGGVQQRQVSCLDNYANVADPSMCTPPMPASSRCDMQRGIMSVLVPHSMLTSRALQAMQIVVETWRPSVMRVILMLVLVSVRLACCIAWRRQHGWLCVAA